MSASIEPNEDVKKRKSQNEDLKRAEWGREILEKSK